MKTKVSIRGLSKGCVAEVSVEGNEEIKVSDLEISDSIVEEAIRVYEKAKRYAAQETMRMS
jgi:hypothetical protein